MLLARDATKHPAMQGTDPTTRIIQSKMSVVPRLRNPGSGFPGGAVVKNLPANAGHTGLSPGPGRSHCHGATKPTPHNY